ncbi:hypothetical protein OQA88_8110 [Cercophora sp. LCS_1]
MASDTPRSDRPRRKIALACEPCRVRKARCNGVKPLCSTCERRGLPLERCIYTVDNARTASTENYIKSLHDRIRELQDLIDSAGLDGSAKASEPPLSPAQTSAARPSPASQSLDAPSPRLRSTAAPSIQELCASPRPTCSPADHADTPKNQSSITGMGTVSTEDDVCQALDSSNDFFFGGSSAANFAKEACASAKVRHTAQTPLKQTLPKSPLGIQRPGHLVFAQADKFPLPPRSLADHLVNCYFDRVYWVYPFFHKPSFLHAYESLWKSRFEQRSEDKPPAGLGLGSSPGADASTIVYHTALNAILAIGCQFSDLSAEDKAVATNSFFQRAKALVGLDFIDMNNIGVVQSLLLLTLFLQCTPIVSMTFGRPAMTAHLPSLSLPSAEEFDVVDMSDDGQAIAPSDVPSKLSFYTQYIEQCRILGEILSIYQLSSGPTESAFGPRMDVIINLDAKLGKYESSLGCMMSWKVPSNLDHLEPDRRRVIITQRGFLHASFLYLRLVLHRPILTQLCANADAELGAAGEKLGSGALYTSFAAESAKVCVGASMDLIELVHGIYKRDVSFGWWWNALYVFTGGLAVNLACLSSPLVNSLGRQRLEQSWLLCQEILGHYSSFSNSAQKSLQLLKRVHADVMARVAETAGNLKPGPVVTLLPPTLMGSERLEVNESDLYHPNLSGSLYWQLLGGMDMETGSGGNGFSWDQSLDMITGRFGVDTYQWH